LLIFWQRTISRSMINEIQIYSCRVVLLRISLRHDQCQIVWGIRNSVPYGLEWQRSCGWHALFPQTLLTVYVLPGHERTPTNARDG
jgi:hypothetical protein